MPSDREAVKLLTVHKAKGLEWEVVFLPALMKGVFPSDRVTDNWVSNPAVLPADLRGDAAAIPQLGDTSQSGLTAYKAALSEQQQLSEDRLAYVAVTRAKQLLVGTGHVWRADLTRPRERSKYLNAILDEAARQGQVLADAGPPGDSNPLIVDAPPRLWPQPLDPEALARRQEAASSVGRARERFARTGSFDDSAALPLLLDDEELVTGWDTDLDRLLAEVAENRAADARVALPDQLTATDVLQLRQDPRAYAAGLARPMPRPPSRAARFGTRFHAWVERYFAGSLPSGGLGQQQLIDPEELADRADFGGGEEVALRDLCRSFAEGQFGSVIPYAVEAAFTLSVGGRLVRGRIDAVYQLDPPGPRFRIVDWKTSAAEAADPWQLALYRIAWAEAHQIDLDEVEAAFYYVRTDELIHPTGLPDRTEVERLLGGDGGAAR